MKKVYTTICLLTIAIAASAQLTLHKPETKVATDITSSSFTANWGAVPNADGYCVFVYDRKEVRADGDVTIMDEGFNGIDFGSIIEPGGGEEEYVDLSAYDYADTYGWSAYGFPNFISGMGRFLKRKFLHLFCFFHFIRKILHNVFSGDDPDKRFLIVQDRNEVLLHGLV